MQSFILAYNQVREHDEQDWDVTLAGGKGPKGGTPKAPRARSRRSRRRR